MFPGYATAYAVVGEEIHAIEDTITDDKERVKFSTYLTGVGFPPRSIYRKMLAGLRGRPVGRRESDKCVQSLRMVDKCQRSLED